MQRRHPLRQLLLRSIVAGGFHALVATGVYPTFAHAAVAVARRRRRLPTPPRELRTLAAEVAATVMVSAARPVGLVGLPLLRAQTQGPRPVILVHGLFMGRMNFMVLAQRLRLAGLGPIMGWEYWTLLPTRKAAEDLGTFVEEVCASTGADKVDLVGHSLGGLVCRAYVTMGGGARRVEHVVTIGSPHQGSPMTSGPGARAFGRDAATMDLCIGSEFLCELDRHPVPDGVRAVNIWSTGDGLVPGRRFAHWPGAEEIEYDDLGHVALLFSPRVAREVSVRLRQQGSTR